MSKLTDLIPDNRNANKGTPRGLSMLEDSLRKYGAGRSILVDKNNRVIAGNKTLESAVDIGIGDALIVETDGKRLVVVKRTDIDLDSKAGRELAIADNRTGQVSLEWDGAIIAELASDGVDLSRFFADEELEALIADVSDSPLATTEPDALTANDVPDAIWPTNNEWGIPLLDLRLQADAVDAPIIGWNTQARGQIKKGCTVHFYVDDFRFTGLWQDPTVILTVGAIIAVEPNTSVFNDMPRAVALHQIYQKRWMARWWQSLGVRIMVDLNVVERHFDLNDMGIPQGWKSFATRGYSDRLDEIDRQYDYAEQKADGATPLFMVYGGGKSVKAHCLERGWLWVAEQFDVAKEALNVAG